TLAGRARAGSEEGGRVMVQQPGDTPGRPPDDIRVDTSSMPRLGRAPVAETAAESREAFKGNWHPSMEDVGLRTFKWNPELERAHGVWADYLRGSQCLPRRDREIAILRSAWNCGSDYQWGMHTEIGLTSGLTQDEIDRIPAWEDGADWAPHEAAVLRA